MPAATAKHTGKPVAKRRTVMAFDESQYVVLRHRGDPEKMRAAIDHAVARAKADKRTGDVCTALREFRNDPRGK